MPSLAGQKLDKYDMLEEVGHGGMAVVYRGRDTILDREVAVKVLHAHLADREESRRRLEREAKTVAKLHHDNIVEIFDSSDPSRARESYIVCEFIHGVTLRDWLDQRWVARPVLAALIAHRLCLPLEHAHSLGIVHRDIKPENVMIRDDGVLKLMDFGIAQILDTQRLTTTGQLLGSPAYMAPELINGKPVDKRIDIFALGVMLYQLATGELPFSGRNPAQVLNRILEGDYKPPHLLDPKVDEDLEAVIAKALALKPEDRYQTASSLANALEDYLAQYGVAPTPAELESYFANPESYVDELDRRVCRELMRKAAKAMREGNGARALKLLGRVLELEPENRRAAAMLDKVRIRGQRMRQAALAGGALALAGIVTAGVLLLQPDPPKPARLDSSEARPSTANGGYYIPNRDPQVLAPVDADTGEDAAAETGPSEGGDGAPQDSSGPRPPSDPSGGRGAGVGTGGKPEPDKVRCRVVVKDLPNSLLSGGDYSLAFGQGRQKLPPSAEVVVEISKRSTVSLLGDAFGGSVTVDPATCIASGPVKLYAIPKAAVLKFQAGGISNSDLIVSCLSGCVEKETLASRFPAIKFERGEFERKIELEFKCNGYRSDRFSYTVYPGSNQLKVVLGKAE